MSLWAESYDPPVFKTIISECYEEGQLTLSSLLASDFFVLSFDVCNEMVGFSFFFILLSLLPLFFYSSHYFLGLSAGSKKPREQK